MKIAAYLGAVLFCFASLSVSAQDTDAVLDKVTSGLEKADAALLRECFADYVNLTIANTNAHYSKDQTKQILKDFFSKNKNEYTFTLKHKGASRDGSMYAIGIIQTSEKKYRVYYLVKKVDTKAVLSQIEFEEEK